jgi:alanyl-tRNA synthetase
LRIVEIEGIEFNACGGTHVQSLGEIAMMKLIKTEKIRGSVRLHFICGTRLLKDYSKNLDIINSIVHKLTTSPTQLQNQIDKIIAENKEFNRKYHLLFEQYAELLGEKLLDEQQGPVIWQLFDDYSIKDLTIISQKIASMSDKVILAGSRSELRIVMAHNGNNSIHLGQFVRENISRFSGKGGGDANKAQVLFSDEEQLQAFADYTKMHIISN